MIGLIKLFIKSFNHGSNGVAVQAIMHPQKPRAFRLSPVGQN